MLFAVVLVFLDWDLVTPARFAGVENLRLLAVDDRFWRAIANTLLFLALHLPVQIVAALGLALALDRPLAWRGADPGPERDRKSTRLNSSTVKSRMPSSA